MGLRGPQRTPTKILQLRGTQRGKYRPDDPDAILAMPACPGWLDAAGQEHWAVLSAQLYAIGVLALIDQAALGRYIQLTQRWLAMEAFIAQHGETYPTRNQEGEVISFQAFPQVAMAAVLATQLHRLEDSFGMTPASRARIHPVKKDTSLARQDAPKNKQQFFRA